MKLNLEKFLNINNLKVGDKIRFVDEKQIYTIARDGNLLFLRTSNGINNRSITSLLVDDFDKVEPPKTVGELVCTFSSCYKCPFRCVACTCTCRAEDTLKKRLEYLLKKYPPLEQMRSYFEAELAKEVD